MDYTASQTWTIPIPTYYGPGRLAEIASIADTARMRTPLIVTDKGCAGLPFVTQVQDVLPQSRLFCDISPNPLDVEIAAGKSAFLDGGHDGIIAIGGGSGMDGGKAIGLVALNDLDLERFEYEQTPPDDVRFPPLICVPTTAGTGAETASTAMVTNTERAMKFCYWHASYLPNAAILDPEVTLELPPNLTAWTGLDAITHAIEAFAVPGFEPHRDAMALEALRQCAQALPRVMTAPDDVAARGALMAGSCLAGIAFQKGLGHVHAISHMIGAEFDTHHGLTNAVVLPSVMRFNERHLGDKAHQMALAVDARSADFAGLYAWLIALLDDLEIPVSLSQIGVPTDCASRIAAKALKDSAAGTNPRYATLAEMTDLITIALTQGR